MAPFLDPAQTLLALLYSLGAGFLLGSLVALVNSWTV